ncbi:hypothetical protein [Ferrimonas balearica]|uniref:hypothetical protein n=1 Tax=Ferrimonas balearica TaxID=44012 RepID=UPI001C9975C9|nr:hypothetical protein [Ferrimonas balearica]MBY5920411.1 hypothetical protein [Ferrimonas balearica]MBY5996904.1 hypothetical protein [Ferrimonas balearica]
MAINPNNTLPARHVFYTATTGGGKSMAVQYAGFVPRVPCLAIFDPYGDYLYKTGSKRDNGFGGKRVYHYSTRRGFARAFRQAWGTRKCFRIAYKPPKPNRAEMLWFCELMWAAADGDRRLDVVIEEVAKWVESTAKEQSILGECMTGGRKFGLVMHTVAQRPTEVPKTITSQSPYKIVGMQESRADAERMMKELDCGFEEIKSLKALCYLLKSPGLSNFSSFKIEMGEWSKNQTTTNLAIDRTTI